MPRASSTTSPRTSSATSTLAEAIVGDADDGGPRAEGRWGTYGNSITYSDSTVFWKQNRKGTANYGCGSAESWNAGKNWASYIVYRGRCPNGVAWYFIGNYRP